MKTCCKKTARMILRDIINLNSSNSVIDNKFILYAGEVQDLIREKYLESLIDMGEFSNTADS